MLQKIWRSIGGLKKMTEMKQIEVIHECGKVIETRITDLKDDKDKEILGWIIYGICKKCNTTIMLELFMQEEKPVQDVDYTFIYEPIKLSKENGL